MEWMLQQLNTIGGAFVSFATLMLVESAVLIGLVLLVEYVFRHKVRAALRYWLVVLVLAYLLLVLRGLRKFYQIILFIPVTGLQLK